MRLRNLVSASAVAFAACCVAAGAQVGAAGATGRAGTSSETSAALAATPSRAPATPPRALHAAPDRTAGGLCADLAAISRIAVRRRDALPENHLRFSFPAVLTRGASSGRQAARALSALPPMPGGVFHCPADLGVTYDLTFSVSRAALASVIVEPAGCETVSGLGPLRSAARSPGFWRTLGAALGLRAADQTTFAGSLPGSSS